MWHSSIKIWYCDHWKKKAIQTYHICQEWDKVKDFTDEPVAQCDVPAIEITSLDDDDHGDCK